MHDAPDLELLRCFVLLHRERHLTRAARHAGLSQPAMSRALGRMRTLFGDPLFVRSPSGMVPTPRADAIAPEVQAVLDAAGALVRPARFDPRELARTFVVATTDSVDAHLVPPLIETLTAAAPGVSLALRPVGDDTADALATGRFDLVIGARELIPSEAIAARLLEDSFVCAVRGDHPGVGKRLTLDRFCELPHLLIAPRGVPGGPVDTALDALGRSRRVVVRTHTFLSAPQIVSRSDLILTAPRCVLEPLAVPFRLRLLAPPLAVPGFDVWSAWHPRFQHDPAHAWFRGLVDAAAKR